MTTTDLTIIHGVNPRQILIFLWIKHLNFLLPATQIMGTNVENRTALNKSGETGHKTGSDAQKIMYGIPTAIAIRNES